MVIAFKKSWLDLIKISLLLCAVMQTRLDWIVWPPDVMCSLMNSELVETFEGVDLLVKNWGRYHRFDDCNMNLKNSVRFSDYQNRLDE